MAAASSTRKAPSKSATKAKVLAKQMPAKKATQRKAAALRRVAKGEAESKQDFKDVKALHDAATAALQAGLPTTELAAMRKLVLKSKVQFTHRVAELIIQTGESPLEFLISKMRDATLPLAVRLDCAKSALPYVHHKLPALAEVDIPPGEGEGEGSGTMAPELADLSTEELALLEKMARKFGEKTVVIQGN